MNSIFFQWPRCSRFLFNTYCGYASLILEGHSSFLFSKEGAGQGDPLSMLMYAAAMTPLIKALENEKWTQNWCTDDSACAAKLPLLHDWFQKLCQLGPSYGYYPEPKKTVVVVDENDTDAANACFHDLDIKVVRGHRFLGGFIGDEEEHTKRFVDER